MTPRPPLTYVRDDVNRRIVFTMTGEVTIESWAAAVAEQIDDGLWSWASLYDLSQADAHHALDLLRDMKGFTAEITRERGTRGPVALIVPAAVLTAYRERFDAHSVSVPYAFEVFTDAEAAAAWLSAVTD
jgi:hypothetical protein